LPTAGHTPLPGGTVAIVQLAILVGNTSRKRPETATPYTGERWQS